MLCPPYFLHAVSKLTQLYLERVCVLACIPAVNEFGTRLNPVKGEEGFSTKEKKDGLENHEVGDGDGDDGR